MKKKKKMNKPVDLRLSILELSKLPIHEFWHEFCCHYVKPKYGFILYLKTNGIYKDTAENVETRFDTSSYALEWNYIGRPMPKEKKMKK